MSTYPTNENIAYCKLYNYYQPIVITSNIKNVMLATYIVYRWEINLNL